MAVMAVLVAAPTVYAGSPTKVEHPSWSRNAVIYEVNTRQYTPEGTFDAFAAHLPRLKELGVDILWFMPIHPISEVNRKGTLGSYYAVRDYKGVNPEFGTLESFKKVVDQAHKLGMKVIIDWVPNHTGCDNAWVAEHPDWYKRNEAGEMYGPYDWTDVYQLDYSNPELRKGMIDALSFWLKEADIDGFRCDVAGLVPVDFWNEARPALEAVKGKGNLFMLAEATEPELLEAAFDMGYNWPMKDLQNAVAATQGEYTFVKPDDSEPAKLDERYGVDLTDLLVQQDYDYPADSYMMNMVTNHDLNSWEGTEYERYGKFLPAMTALTYMLPGMPLIYSGQEAGLNRALEFFEKDCITEFDTLSEPNSRASKMTATLTLLNRLKADYPQLNAGFKPETIDGVPAKMNWFSIPSENEEELIFARVSEDTDNVIAGYFNFGKEAMATEYPAPAVNAWLISANGPEVLNINQLPASINPGEAMIVEMKRMEEPSERYTEIQIVDD